MKERIGCYFDDPHNIKEGESQTIREETVRWFREAMSNRLNHMTKSAIIVIMQRVHQEDVSGTIIHENLGYDHLMIPMLYEEGAHCHTKLGWTDPRSVDGECFWPERFPPAAVEECLKLGEFAFASQYQQRPAPRGGGIFKNEYWNIWEPEDGRYPRFDFILASVDPAYTHHDENDPSAMTVWGLNYADDGTPRVFLIAAWRKWLQIHGPEVEREYGEPLQAYEERRKKSWGLVEWISHTCKRFQVDRLIVEAKASGISVVQELQRLLFQQQFGIEFVNPGRADKEVRANRVQHIWSAGMIYRPDRPWAEMVEEEMAAFPKARYDDLCLVAGTLISTRRGPVPIDEVTCDDEVITPIGWRKVVMAGQTGVREVISNAGLTGTANHPIFDIDLGFIPLDSVTQASRLSRISVCDLTRTIRQKQLFSTEKHTGLWAVGENTISNSQRLEKESRDCTSLFGNFIQGALPQKTMRSTIKTAILLILAIVIWSAYRKVCIERSLKSISQKARLSISRKFDRLPPLGISLRKAAHGISNMLLNLFRSPESKDLRSDPLGSSLVSGAATGLSGRTSEMFCAPPHASFKNPRICEGRTNLSIRSSQPVYNLEVEGAHCYYANGVLVHNCDSATQALWWFRQNNMLMRREEIRAANDPETSSSSNPLAGSAPLYPM